MEYSTLLGALKLSGMILLLLPHQPGIQKHSRGRGRGYIEAAYIDAKLLVLLLLPHQHVINGLPGSQKHSRGRGCTDAAGQSSNSTGPHCTGLIMHTCLPTQTFSRSMLLD
jgi:hypothetical protein